MAQKILGHTRPRTSSDQYARTHATHTCYVVHVENLTTTKHWSTIVDKRVNRKGRVLLSSPLFLMGKPQKKRQLPLYAAVPFGCSEALGNSGTAVNNKVPIYQLGGVRSGPCKRIPDG